MLFKKSKKTYLHIDCDCFYVSCEVLKNPRLKGKRVCVGGEVIITSSYESRAVGVKVGTPIWEAKRTLGESGVFLLPDHNYYSEISKQIEKYLIYNTLKYEPYSIDEGFADITGLPELYKISTLDYINQLQKNILKETGIPVSIGCSNTRIKAKIFSKLNKPYGIYIASNEKQEVDLFKKLPIKDIPYIGKSYQERFKYSCVTIYDFIYLGFWNIKKNIGKNGTDLWLELSGVNAFVVKKSLEPKSIGRSRSFNKKKTNNYLFLKKQLLLNFDKVFEDISNKNLEIKTISIMLRDIEFNTLLYRKTLTTHTNNRKEILDNVFKLFEINYVNTKVYRSTGIVFSDFISYLPKQISIFDKPLRNKEQNYELIKIVNSINSKYGSHKISFGFSLLNKGFEAKLGILKLY